MYKFGGHILCEKCSTIIVTGFNFLTHTPHWERVLSRRKDQGAGRGRVLDFCNEQCRILFLRGRKYYQRKLQHMKDNGHENN